MIRPIAVGQIFDYIIPEDKKNPTIWKLTELDSITESMITSQLISIIPSKDKNNPELITLKPEVGAAMKVDFLVVKLGLKGFENFKIGSKEVEFKTEKYNLAGKDYEVVSEETVKHIPRSIIMQLSSRIFQASKITEEEEKN